MENEMKALAQSLALFLNTEATVSGLLRERVWLSDIARGLFSALITRSTNADVPIATAARKDSESFFYRYIFAAQKDIGFAEDKLSAVKTAEYYPEPAAMSLAELSMGMADGVLTNRLVTELLMRERMVNRYEKQPAVQLQNTAEKAGVESPFSERAVYKTQQPAAVSEKLSGFEISRISDALGEQLHQKLAAGFPMYVR